MSTRSLLTARDVVIPDGPAGRPRRLVALQICSSSACGLLIAARGPVRR